MGKGKVIEDKEKTDQEKIQETAPPEGGPVEQDKIPTVMGIISRVRNDSNLSDKDKIDTFSLLVQKFVEENQEMREDITSLGEQMTKHREAKKAMKALNEAYKKQIEMVREEGKLRLEEEQSKRQDSMGGYSTSMSELATLLETQSSQNGRLQTDNTVMVDQMSLLIGETEKRELAIQRMQQEFQLQLKLLEHQVAKAQIEKLTSQMVQLEKDTAQWREKYEVSSQQVKKMNTATMDKEKEVVSLKKKLDTMVKLNKTLTTERATLTEKVKQLES